MLPKENFEQVKKLIRELLTALGEDPNRDGLKQTPERVAKLYSDILDGNYHDQPKIKFFEEKTYDNIVVVKKVPFYAFCEHHLLMFLGTFSVGYIPNKRVAGLSKLVRVFRYYAKRPTIQERLTAQTVDAIMKAVQPKGVIVHVEAEHTCMTLRGIKSPGSTTATTAYRGIFAEEATLRQQFLDEVCG